jgi:hypothetical protein
LSVDECEGFSIASVMTSSYGDRSDMIMCYIGKVDMSEVLVVYCEGII